MSAVKRAAEAKWKDKRPVGPSLLTKFAGDGENGGGAPAGWGDVDTNMLVDFVVWFTNAGGAVTLGKSRDGQVLNLTLMHNGEVAKRWFKASDVAEGAVETFLAQVWGSAEDKQKGP